MSRAVPDALKQRPRQEMPPPGGYKPLNFAKRLPPPRISGLGLFALVGITVTVGFIRVIDSNQKRRAIKEEKREMRASILPFLQAEEDLRFLELQKHQINEDKKIVSTLDSNRQWNVESNTYNNQHLAGKAIPRTIC